MAFEVIFTKRADRDLETILSYIQKDFGDRTAIEFKNSVIKFVSLIQLFPELGRLELATKNIHSLVIHRRLKIYYRIKDEKIILLRLYDTRQSPYI